MRYWEIASGLRVPVSSEQQELIDLVQSGQNRRDALDERWQQLAMEMVSQGLLRRVRDADGRTCFEVSSATDIWREPSW